MPNCFLSSLKLTELASLVLINQMIKSTISTLFFITNSNYLQLQKKKTTKKKKTTNKQYVLQYSSKMEDIYFKYNFKKKL